MPKDAKRFRNVIIIIFMLNQIAKANELKITTVESAKLVVKNRESFQETITKDTLILKNDQNTFKILFTTSEPNLTFSYRLVGLESIENLTKNNYAYYTNLDDGEYDFYVYESTNKNNRANLHLIIESPFWLQWWFAPLIFAFVMIILSAIIYLIFLYRFSQKMHLQRVRNDIASDLHDDVGATLSSISFFGEMMRSKIQKNAPKEEVLSLLEKLISTSKETIQTMRGVVWTINPNNDTAVDFFQKLHSFGREMLASKNINLNFESEGFDKLKLPLEIQRNLFLFYKETINNIAKHSQATDVEATFKALQTGEVWVGLSDNGKGFNINELSDGHGLKSLKKRADELDGRLEIKSEEGKGTSVSLSFPLP